MSNPFEISSVKGLAKLISLNSSYFSITNNRQLLFKGDFSSIQDELKALNIDSSTDGDGHILNIKAILKDYKIIHYTWIDQDLGINEIHHNVFVLQLSGEYVLVENGEIIATSGDISYESEIVNAINYYRLCFSLRSDKISDHHNEAREEYVLYSSTKGVMKIKYATAAPRLREHLHKDGILSLIEIIENTQYKIYFINALFKFSSERSSVDLTSIIKNTDSIISMVKRDYELVLRQFDFDKFKDHLLKEKDKYFTSIREIINKVFGQLIGIPISIAASAFATYKVEGDVMTLILITISFVFYTLLYVKIQFVYRNDIKELGSDFKRDFKIIRDKSGLSAELIDVEVEIPRNVTTLFRLNVTTFFRSKVTTTFRGKLTT